ncbi:MAG: radical SAM protein [Actinomycetota bacterium]
MRGHPDELSTEQGLDLIKQAARMGMRVFVVTGGDPLARPDVFDLVGAAHRSRMHVGSLPASRRA